MNDEKQLLIDFLNSSNRSQLLNLVVLTPFTTKELRVLNGFLAMNFPDFEAKESLLTNLIFKCTEIPRDEYSFTSIVTELDYFAKMFDLSVDWNGLAENPSADTLAGELVSSVLEIAVDQLKTEGLLTPLATDDQAPVIGNESLPLNFQDTTNSQVTNSQIQNESLPSQFQLGDSLPSDTGANISLEHDDLAEIPMENIELQMECVSNDEMHRNASNRELVSKELCVATGLSMESTEGAEFQTADEESVRVDISDESSHTANVVDDFQTRVEEVTDADEILIADRQIAVLENVSPEVEGVVVGIQAMVDTSTVVVENLISVEGVTTNDTVDIAPVAEENTTLEQKFGTFSSPSSPPIQVTLNLKETVDVVSDSQDVDKDPEELAMEIDNDREIFYDVADQPADITSAIIRNTTPTPAEPRPENFLMESEEKIDLVLDSQRVGEVAEDSLMEFDDSQIHFSSPAPKHTGLGTPTKSLIVNISEPPTTTSVRFQDSVGVIENNMFDDNSESDDDMKSAAEFDGNYAASQSLYYDSQPSVNTPTGITAPNPTPAAFRSGTKADNFEHEQLKPLDECWSTLRTQLYQSIRNADADTRVHRLSVENQEKHLLVARLEQELESKTESISNLAETFSENRSELQQMRNQVQVDLEIAQVDATTTLVALKEEVASKLQEIQVNYLFIV